MSKERQSTAETLRRLRTYRRYVRTQPKQGWGHDTTRDGRLELTAMASAGL